VALFKKNPNEVAYIDGKKHWTDVIKNSGPGELLIWRQPEEDFNTNSTLIVMPGEEAIFIKNGNVEQIFESGTYQLSTKNYPFISRLKNAFSGGISTFNCVVYFIRKAQSFEIRWGTDSPIQVRDKLLGISTKLRCRGSYKIQVDNSVKFLEELIGNNVSLQFQEELNKYFISAFQSKIKSVIARAVNESNTELLGIDAHLDEFSEVIEPFIREALEAYGLRCVKFVISAIDIEDDELRKKYDEIGMEAIAKMREAIANKEVMGILGDDWGRQQSADILSDLANNSSVSDSATIGAGMGMGIGAGNVFATMAQQMFAPMAKAYTQPQQPPAQAISSGRFIQQHTLPENIILDKSQTSMEDPMSVLMKFKKMLDAGLISQEDYDSKKNNILDKMSKENKE